MPCTLKQQVPHSIYQVPPGKIRSLGSSVAISPLCLRAQETAPCSSAWLPRLLCYIMEPNLALGHIPPASSFFSPLPATLGLEKVTLPQTSWLPGEPLGVNRVNSGGSLYTVQTVLPTIRNVSAQGNIAVFCLLAKLLLVGKWIQGVTQSAKPQEVFLTGEDLKLPVSPLPQFLSVRDPLADWRSVFT